MLVAAELVPPSRFFPARKRKTLVSLDHEIWLNVVPQAGLFPRVWSVRFGTQSDRRVISRRPSRSSVLCRDIRSSSRQIHD